MSTTAEKEQISQKLQQQYNNYQENIAELENQLSSLTSQVQEHAIVDTTLSSIPPESRAGRKCFKMIGGVLINKSVDEVIKILNDEIKELTTQRAKVDEALKKNRKGLEEWMKNNHVKIIRNQ
ncbi:prefoldin subunit 2 [Scheffersomyces xylosifermentans]|uniref:prefoldin subunit 2 n=1 Tax=Scheffersomyces xylosifermentans TaxID=1304137 RepID=UPI00315DC498